MALISVPLPKENNSLELTEEQRGKLLSQEWRLNNLYKVVDGRVPGAPVVTFKMNWAQRQLFKAMWYLNVILKARQIGMSTFIQLWMLDICLWNSNQNALIIAQGKKEAQDLFANKIKFAYDNLPDEIKAMRPADTKTAMELKFNNGSHISVGTSGRSGTFQMLHVSEFGKICKKYPEKAREIVTGAFEAVHPGNMIFVESTAEGREGKFYSMAMEAKKLKDMRADLSKLDFKYWFLPWWKHPENVLDPTNVIIWPPLQDYYTELEQKIKIRLTAGQKAWYAKKWARLGDDIKREHPSTPEEAFEQITEGSYLAKQITQARKDGRVGKVPHQTGVQVDTYWDIGLNDTQTCWFVQQVGSSFHIIDYYENSGEDLGHYWQMLCDRSDELKYQYGRHVWPHDGGHSHQGLDKRPLQEQALDLGWRVDVLPRQDFQASMNNARNILSICWFDEGRCDTVSTTMLEQTGGILALESWRKEWDEKLGSWKKTELHDWASHGAAGFRTFADTVYKVIQGRTQAQARTVTKRRIV